MITDLKDKISTVQATLTVASTIIGVGILTLPRTVTEAMGTPDAWMAVLLGGMIAMAAGYVLIKLNEKFPEKTFYQYSELIVGRFLGRVFSLLLILHFALFAGFEVRMLAELVRTYLLHKTPIELIVITFLGAGIYLVVGGVNPLVRLLEAHFPIIIFLAAVIVSLSFREVELENLRPVLAKGLKPLVKGIKATTLSYTGYESMLILTAFMKKRHQAVKTILVGVGIPMILYTVIVIVAVGALTVEEVKTLTWPLATLSVEIELPGGIIERFEVVFIVLWILIIYTSFVVPYYLSGLGLGQIFKRDINSFMYGLLLVIYLVAMVPPDINTVFKLGDLIGYTGLAAGGLVPFILLGVASIRGINDEKN